MIIIRPQAGLGNRLRALDSAVHLSRKLDIPLTIKWVRNKDCNCAFFDLFELTDSFNVIETSGFVRDNGKAEKMLGPLQRLFIKWTEGLSTGVYFNDQIVAMKQEPEFWNQFMQFDKLYIQTETSFMTGNKPFYYLKPNTFIKQAVDDITVPFNDDTLGIHIRRRDNVNATAHSPTELFMEKMNKAVDAHRETNFFLATDAESEEVKLRKIFGEKIITYPKRSYDRNSTKAIQDALIDMLCLSHTNKIIGSYYSSFSEIAAQFGGIELEVMQK
jgi:hypothetical protein